MKTLALDTSNKFLIVCLIDNDQVVAYHQELAVKNQSERVMLVIDQLISGVMWQPTQIQQIVITAGPGSYTGVRIAMTIAKVMAASLNIPLYSISSLQLYAGIEDCKVVIDARGGRVYYAHYNQGNIIEHDTIKTIEELANDFNINSHQYLGDLNIFQAEDKYPNFKNNFLDLKTHWQLVNDVHHLKPNYLKEQSEYQV
jgi:tRNA threonylcarbamoyladenosine biosynthesis protein TsaB